MVALMGWIARDPRFEVSEGLLRLVDGHDDPDRLPVDEAAFVVVDLETTGTGRADTITEIGAVRVREGRLEEAWSTLVDPGVRLPAFITRLTGIHDEMLEGQPPLSEALMNRGRQVQTVELESDVDSPGETPVWPWSPDNIYSTTA